MSTNTRNKKQKQNGKSSSNSRSIKILTASSSYYGKEKVWDIYPDNWRYGPAPYLGSVRADDEYWAKYAAIDAGIVSRNDSFDILAIQNVSEG